MKRFLITLALLMFGFMSTFAGVYATVPNTTFENSYTGDGSTTVFTFTWRLIDPTQMIVQIGNVTQSPGNYTVFQNSNGIGGTVTFNTAPGSGLNVLIERVSDFLQNDHLPNNAALPPATLEAMVDKSMIAIQQLSNEIEVSAGSVSNFTAPTSGWPTWLQPSVATSNTTPALSVTMGTLTGDIASITQSGLSTLMQPLHALVGYNTNGFMCQTATNNFTGRTLGSAASTITVTNGSGASGNPNFDLPTTGVTAGSYTATNLTVDQYGRITSAANGSGGSGGGVSSFSAPTTNWPSWLVPSVANASSTPALSVAMGSVSGDMSSISSGGSFTLAQPLHSLVSYNTNGLLTQTAPNTFTGRTLGSSGSTITVTNGNGVSGNPNVDLPTTGVSSGSYSNPNITVDSYGRITAASNGSGSSRYTSSAQTFAASNQYTLTHGLGTTPVKVWMVIQNVTTEQGYSPGDQIIYWPNDGANTASGQQGITVNVTNTSLVINTSGNGPLIAAKGGGAGGQLTFSKWEFFVYAEP